MEPTSPSQFEKGRPLSRAKANVCREADARELIVIMTINTRTITTSIVAPAVLLTASRKTWIKGKPVGESRALCTSGIQNR